MAKRKKKVLIKKWPPYTRWYDKIPRNKEDERLREQCRELGINNIIWG
jgi:hypothetical protein